MDAGALGGAQDLIPGFLALAQPSPQPQLHLKELEISFRDFCILLCDKSVDLIGPTTSKRKQSLGQLLRANLTDMRKSFELIDKSKDGYVEPDEINHILGFFDLHQDEAFLREKVSQLGKFGTCTVSLPDFAADLVSEVHLESGAEAQRGFQEEAEVEAKKARMCELMRILTLTLTLTLTLILTQTGADVRADANSPGESHLQRKRGARRPPPLQEALRPEILLESGPPGPRAFAAVCAGDPAQARGRADPAWCAGQRDDDGGVRESQHRREPIREDGHQLPDLPRRHHGRG